MYLLHRLPLLSHLARRAVTTEVPRRQAAAIGGKKPLGGKTGPVQKKKTFDVETDTKVLVTHCCGLNYKLDGGHVELKPHSEYPEWLYKMDVNRPEPTSDELEPGTMEYFLALKQEANVRYRTLHKKKKKTKK